MNITIAGVRATSATIHVPQVGAWVADVDLDSAAALPSSKIALRVGAAEFTGTIDPRFSGTFAGRRRVRLVAGGNGWWRQISARHFHNDAGVRPKTVLQATAEECGEILTFSGANNPIGVDYVRQAGRGGAALLRLAGTGWYVDYAGVTQVGARVVKPTGKFEVLDFDARQNIATLGTNEAQAVGIGTVLTERLDTPLTVRDLRIVVGEDGARVYAWGTT